MAFYLPLTFITWAAAWLLIDWRRLPELLVYGLAGIVIAGLEDKVGLITGWWLYQDTGPITSHPAISLLICASAAPTFAMYFAQGLRSLAFPLGRILVFTAVSMTPEVLGLFMGKIIYGDHWNVAFSVLAHLPTWCSFWVLYCYYQKHPVQAR